MMMSCTTVLVIASYGLWISSAAVVPVTLWGAAAVLRFTSIGRNNVEPLMVAVATTCLMSIPLGSTTLYLISAQEHVDKCTACSERVNLTDQTCALDVTSKNLTIGVTDSGCREFARGIGNWNAMKSLLDWVQVFY